MNDTIAYPHLNWLSEEHGISTDALIRIFAVEKTFHTTILATDSADERVRQYEQLYTQVYRIKCEGAIGETREGTSDQHARLVLTFARELKGKSVLEVGCGDGQFLAQIEWLLPHGRLCGLDTSNVTMPRGHAGIRFLKGSVIDFRLESKFDVVYSHQVLEHIAPADLPAHLRSVHSALEADGRFIVLLPNKYWGPQDITRIVDNTFTGRVPAMGSHLNESSYTELVPQLEAAGFRDVRTILPFAAFIAPLRFVRVRPWINRLLERHAALRRVANTVRAHGRPIFRNPVVLVCRKASPHGI
jgi:SAM-dependent methyltransferase